MPRATIERMVVPVGLAMAAFVFGVAGASADPRCQCRYAGEMYFEGQCVCMQTPNGQQQACCGRVLNNTSWSFIGGCPVAATTHGRNPGKRAAPPGSAAAADRPNPLPQQAHRTD